MKKRLLPLFLILLLSTQALAEGMVYCRSDTYHATPLCLGMGGDREELERLLSLSAQGGNSGEAADIILEKSYPTLPESDARDFGFLACPVCVQDETDYGDLHAVERGGTLVLRVPDPWIQSRHLFTVWVSTEKMFTGDDAQRQLATYIHGEPYAAFLEAAAREDEAEASVEALWPDIEDDDGLVMNARHIGEVWFLVVRPNKDARVQMKRNGALELGLRLEGGPMRWRENTLIWEGWGLRYEARHKIALDAIDGTPVYSGDFENLTLTLFHEMGANILVIRESRGDADWLEGAILTLDDVPSADGLNGYMDGQEAVYVCTLTDIEAIALKNGAFPRLRHPGRVTAQVMEDDGWRLEDVSESARNEGPYDYTVFFRDGALYITNNADEECQAVTVYLQEGNVYDVGPSVRLDTVPLGKTLKVFDQNDVLYLGNGGEELYAWASPTSENTGIFISNYDHVWGAWVDDKWLYGHTPVDTNADSAVFIDDSGIAHILNADEMN